jgi:uncharacterized cupredoxin-like copper-binding protein
MSLFHRPRVRRSLIAGVLGFALIASACAPDDELAAPVTADSISSDASVPLIDLSEFSIKGDLTVPAGAVVVDVLNRGSAIHTLALADGPKTANLNSGEGALLDLGNLAPGSYEIFCDIPGHRESGMTTQLTVVPASEAGTVTISTQRSTAEPDWAALEEAMAASIAAFPAETEGVGNVLLEPTILPDGTKEFDLTVAVTPWEVEPGRIVDAWSYNGVVPGPEIRVDVGDRIRVNVTNELPLSTDVHWHGIPTPNGMDGVSGITQDPILPGETFVYEFAAERNMTGMYHAHRFGQIAIPNGLFGLFTVGDVPIPRGETINDTTIPEDLVIDRNIPIVLNDAGVIGYSLNGKSFPATEPYVVEQGDWITATYYNEGLQIHPMHLHQFPQLVIAKDGFPLDNPYYADTVNVAPGERYTVLINATEPGAWVWHCHILSHVDSEDGLFGMVTALIVT